MSVVAPQLRLVCLLSLLVSSSFSGANDEPATQAISTDLEPSWLETTKHPQTGLLSRGVRPEEAVGYFAILNHARHLPLEDLKSAANEFQKERLAAIRRDPNFRFYFQKPNAEFPTFADLHRNPEAYHGRLVTLRGHLRRLVTSSAGQNPHSLPPLHEAWLYVEGAQQNPVVVVCTELPPNMPTGTDLLVDFVSATGYFFKRYGYEDRSGQLRFAPLILAQRLEWTPLPQRSFWLSSGQLFGLTILAAIVVAACWWQYARQRGLVSKQQPSDEFQLPNSDTQSQPIVPSGGD